jgi:nucleotide-binding universal stress UspA family protein
MKAKRFFQTVLVPVDGSHSCLRAEQLAAVIASKFHSKVAVIHVVSHDFMHPELRASYQLPPLILKEIRNWYLKAGKKIIRTAEELFKEENIHVDSRVIEHEDPAEIILELVKKWGYDLVVMGNRTETHAERFSLGNVSEKVALYAQCPVLIVKRKTKLSKLLVAIDGSKRAEKALEYAVELAQKYKAKITLMHVEEPKLLHLEPKVIGEVGERILSDAAAKIKGLEFDKRLEFGNAAQSIIRFARDEDYDLIVIGNRGLNSIKRFFLGSVSADVSMHAKCSVLIVR